MFTEQVVASVVVLIRAVFVGRAAVSPEASEREPLCLLLQADVPLAERIVFLERNCIISLYATYKNVVKANDFLFLPKNAYANSRTVGWTANGRFIGFAEATGCCISEVIPRACIISHAANAAFPASRTPFCFEAQFQADCKRAVVKCPPSVVDSFDV
jgi:hypothetical protein